jgi:predicted amidohydrolase YtcJ
MENGSGGRRPARGWPGSGAGPRGRAPGPRRHQPRYLRLPGARLAALVSALAGTALLAACSSGGAPVSAKQTNYQKAVAFSACMRAHGEPGFPDPQPNGNLIVDGRKDHLNGALMNSASKACQHLMPVGPPMTAAQQQKVTARALKFVACMRAHGLPTFPDPKVNAQGIELQLPSGVAPNLAVLRNAQQACRSLLPGGPP